MIVKTGLLGKPVIFCDSCGDMITTSAIVASHRNIEEGTVRERNKYAARDRHYCNGDCWSRPKKDKNLS